MDGKALAARVRDEVAQQVARGPQPRLATVLVGDDPASELYVGLKHKAAREVGIEPVDHRPPPRPPKPTSSTSSDG
jgi:methylenetetrahydrofolate dehydrogenase (NADP+)/methenyltetrahydrofolate cyclohydrolase